MVKPLDLVLGQNCWRSRLGFSLQSKEFSDLLPGCQRTSRGDKRQGQKSSYCDGRKRAPARSWWLQGIGRGLGAASRAERSVVGGRLQARVFGCAHGESVGFTPDGVKLLPGDSVPSRFFARPETGLGKVLP